MIVLCLKVSILLRPVCQSPKASLSLAVLEWSLLMHTQDRMHEPISRDKDLHTEVIMGLYLQQSNAIN